MQHSSSEMFFNLLSMYQQRCVMVCHEAMSRERDSMSQWDLPEHFCLWNCDLPFWGCLALILLEKGLSLCIAVRYLFLVSPWCYGLSSTCVSGNHPNSSPQTLIGTGWHKHIIVKASRSSLFQIVSIWFNALHTSALRVLMSLSWSLQDLRYVKSWSPDLVSFCFTTSIEKVDRSETSTLKTKPNKSLFTLSPRPTFLHSSSTWQSSSKWVCWISLEKRTMSSAKIVYADLRV